MTRTLLATALLLTTLHAQSPAQTPPQTPDEQAVLVPVNALFAGMSHRDTAAIKAAFIPGATMVLMRDGNPGQMTADSFADRVGKPSTTQPPTQIEERVHDPLIRVDNDLAVVWAPFDFLSNGKVDHCGTDLFNLVRTNGKWLIASVADTGRKDCPAKIAQQQQPNTQPLKGAPMARVTGIGGVFLRARDPKSLTSWYAQHLGIQLADYGGATFHWSDEVPPTTGMTTWMLFPENTTYFGPGNDKGPQQAMINYRVDNLDEILAQLAAANVTINPKREDAPYGRFAWITDPEGNRIELWQPLVTPPKQ